MIVLGLLVVLAVLVAAGLGHAPPASPGVAFPSPPAAACQGPGSAAKGGQTVAFEWLPVVEIDRPTGSAIVLTSGDSTQVCLASRTTLGGLGADFGGLSTDSAVRPADLTLDSGVDLTATGFDLIYGRVPTGTSRVLVSLGDQDAQVATVSNGYWLMWFAVPSTPVEIDAYDAAGRVLRRLADPNGLQPGG